MNKDPLNWNDKINRVNWPTKWSVLHKLYKAACPDYSTHSLAHTKSELANYVRELPSGRLKPVSPSPPVWYTQDSPEFDNRWDARRWLRKHRKLDSDYREAL